ncbi:hypothetical protein Tco_0890176, partial [Tanacetum coccineum]
MVVARLRWRVVCGGVGRGKSWSQRKRCGQSSNQGNELRKAKAVEKRFRGNDATKKTQRNLLKQQYENFTASSSEV